MMYKKILGGIIIPIAALMVGCASNENRFRNLDDIVAYQNKLSVVDVPRHEDSYEKRKAQAEFFQKKESIINHALLQAKGAIALGKGDDARVIYQKVLEAVPNHTHALEGIRVLDLLRSHEALLESATSDYNFGNLETARDKVRRVLTEDSRNRTAQQLMTKITTAMDAHQRERVPRTGPLFQKRVTLEFRDANLRAIVDILGKTYGINFVIDHEVRADLKTSITIQNATLEDALKLLLVTNRLDYRLLKENLAIIFPKTPAKEAEYREEVVRTFFLANADPKQVANLIKTVLKVKDVVVDERLNTIIVRDTVDKVVATERLIVAQDMADAEVLLEVEVLEISANRLMDLGINYPNRISGSITSSSGKAGVLSWQEFTHMNSGMVSITIPDPAIVLNLAKIDTDTNLLANPSVRVKNREKAKVHIGERVPVITTTSTANVGVSESVSYLDTGLKVELQPNVYLNDDVAINVNMEVSNIIDTVTTSAGTKAYRLGTRNTSTMLRLRDGETQMLAGLIQDDERSAANKIPLLGDIPVLGKLFSSSAGNRNKTEIVMLITPHVVRNITQPEASFVEFVPESSGLNLSGGTAALPSASPGPQN